MAVVKAVAEDHMIENNVRPFCLKNFRARPVDDSGLPVHHVENPRRGAKAHLQVVVQL